MDEAEQCLTRDEAIQSLLAPLLERLVVQIRYDASHSMHREANPSSHGHIIDQIANVSSRTARSEVAFFYRIKRCRAANTQADIATRTIAILSGTARSATVTKFDAMYVTHILRENLPLLISAEN